MTTYFEEHTFNALLRITSFSHFRNLSIYMLNLQCCNKMVSVAKVTSANLHAKKHNNGRKMKSRTRKTACLRTSWRNHTCTTRTQAPSICWNAKQRPLFKQSERHKHSIEERQTKDGSRDTIHPAQQTRTIKALEWGGWAASAEGASIYSICAFLCWTPRK